MRVVVHDHSGHPFQVQLSRSLAKIGHDVLHVFNASFQSPRGILIKKSNDPPNFDIKPIIMPSPFKKYSYLKRQRQEIKYGKIFIKLLKEFNPKIIISANTPIDSQSIIQKYSIKNGINFIFWVQDLYSLAISRIIGKKSPFLGKIIAWIYEHREQSLLRKSDKIVLITEDFIPIMKKWKVHSDKIHVIENWAPLDDIPLMPKTNPWSEMTELADKDCFLYSGTLGKKHNPELILELARHFSRFPKVRIVVISEGIGADYLKEYKENLKLDNLILYGYQPFEKMPEVLASASVLLAQLESDAGVYSVPSKVLSYLCVGRPLLLAVPVENLVARIVMENKTGIVVPPNNKTEFINAAKLLLEDSSLRKKLGSNARRYAEGHFNIKLISQKFNNLIMNCQ